MASNWNKITIDGIDYIEVDVAKFRFPLDWDPYSMAWMGVAAPNDEAEANWPLLDKGEPGPAPVFDAPTGVPLAHNDATPMRVVQTLVTPGTATEPPVYHQEFWLHEGEPGDDGQMTIMGASDLAGIPVAKNIVVVNAAADGFEYKPQPAVFRMTPPAVLNSTPSGNPSYTLGVLSVPAMPFAWRPLISAQTIVTGGGTDVRCDLIARLNNETAGNIVGRCFGISGSVDRLSLSSGPPKGSADAYDKVDAGVAASIYLRIERQAGTATFTTSASTTYLNGWGVPIL